MRSRLKCRLGRGCWLVMLLCSASGVCADGATFNDRLARIDALFADCDHPDSPGCAVGVVRRGELVYSRGFGSANLDYGAPNAPITIFELASASKAFTSACVALLMDRGKLSPDDDVRMLVPELKDVEAPLKIRHLLRCESGLWAQYHIMPLAGWENVPIQAAYSKADLLTVLAGQRQLPFEPGAEFQYSSGDFFWLGIVVERVTGQTLPAFALENLFKPLGMTRTYYEEDPGLVVPNRAVGHWKGDAGWSSQGPQATGRWRQWRINAYPVGGGGVRTCVEDLARWDQAFETDVLPRGRYLNELLSDGCVLGNRFTLDADAYKKHVQPHPENPPAGQYRGVKRFQFTGGFWGTTACISRFPTERLTLICLSNSSEVSAFAKTRAMADLLLADVLEPLAPAEAAEESFIELPLQRLEANTGAFRRRANAPVWRMEIRDGKLVLVDHLEKAFVLRPLSRTRFKAVGDNPFYPSARFEFESGPAGAAAMTLSSYENQFHEVLRFERVELVQPTADELTDYPGTYVSEELAATYRVKLHDDSLWLRVNSRRWEWLKPLLRDEFTPHALDPHDQRFVRFTRDACGAVDGLSVGFWRIRGVRFSKR